MSKKSIKTVLLIEDNPGDARLLREMLQEEGSYSIRADACGVAWATPRSILRSMPLISSCSTWGCPMRKDWKRYGGLTQLRPASRWWC